jgi:signal transduction histidine kinase
VIRVAVDPNSPPFEWIAEDGSYQGISADLIRLIEKKLGIRFEILPARDWAQVLEMAKDHKADLLTSVVRSKDREAYLNFTHPYLSLPGVIISSQQINSLEGLEGRKVAVVSGGIWDERISGHDDRVSIVRVEDTRTALDLATLGGVDALVSNLATISYLIGKEGITNLKVVARVPDFLELSIGIRKDWPEFLPILEKALDSIPAEQIDEIKNRWIDVRHPELHISPIFWYLGLGGIAVLLLVLIGITAWNRSLKKRVAIRSRELEQAQARLAHAEKMESIGLLALGVAHEIKNPLAILQMGLDFLDGDTKRNETDRAILRDMSGALHRADTIIENLQIFSRKKNLSMVSGSVNQVILDALAEFEAPFKEHQILINTRLAEELPDLVMDYVQLKQGLANLIQNAVLAMDEGGTLDISTSRARLSNEDLAQDFSSTLQPGEPVIRVEITDTGPGIESGLLHRIFDPFFTTRPQGEGTGLGLSLTQNIVKLHNGLINIRNRDSGGISVVILFRIFEGELL